MFITPPPPPPTLEPITIFIHGTRSSAFLPIKLSKKVYDLEKEIYCQPAGLRPIAEVPQVTYSRRSMEHLAAACPKNFALSSIYLFGWSGDLSPLARQQEAALLYQQLKQLKAHYDFYGLALPPITIIAHSHGGNVALNLIKCFEQEPIPIVIDRLILLGSPVQEETAGLLPHPFFKTVFSFHSHTDWAQILDIQKLHPFFRLLWDKSEKISWRAIKKALSDSWQIPFFSERHFKPNARVIHVNCFWQSVTPWNDEDIAIFSHFQKELKATIGKWRRPHHVWHIEFIFPSFLKRLDGILSDVSHHAAQLPNKNENCYFAVKI